MVGSMADLLLLTLLTAVILILLTTFIGILILPFLNASNQDVRDLFLAVKDLALPMGSFPSKLLRHESSKAMLQVIPTELNPQENHNVIKDVIIQKTPMEISAGEDSRLISTPSQQSNDEPAAQITPPSVTPGNTDENTERVISDLSEMVKEKETLEAYIRQMADPGDSRGLAAMSLSSLIPWVMQQNERNMRNLRMENNEREDEIYSARQAFEAVIIGQNVAMREMDHERGVAREQASELRVENWHLCGGSKKAEMSDESTIEELRRRAKRAEGTAQEARAFADQTTTGVEDRIRKLKATHAQAMADAAFQNLQERNSLICSRRMVHDNLIDARHQIDEQKQQHQDAMRERNTVIKELDAMNKRLRLTAAASEQLAASVEERLQKQLDDQRKTATELQQTITNLESGQKVKELTDGLLRQVEAAKNNEQEVRTRVQSLEEERVRVAEQHQNAINEKDRKIQNLEQTVGETNSRLEHQVGVRVEVARQVEAAKNNEQEARTQVQTLEEEKVRIAEQHQNAINDINEKDRKIQDLEQTVGENNSRLEHQVGVEVARRLKMAVDAKEVDVWNEAVQQDGDSNMEHEEGDTSAAKEAKKRFQVHLGSERRTMVGKLSEATETGNKLRAEVGDLKSQIERNKVAAELADTKKTESEPADNKKESSSTAGEMDEANSILEEIGEQGIPRICGERLLLNELNKAKRTLASVKHEVQQPEPDKNDLLYAISEASIDEGRFQQCDFRKRPVLLRQARAANEKLYALQRLLNTDSEVQKDAVLGILQSPGKNQTMVLADETGAHGRSAEFATVNARQGQDDLIMGEASEIQNNIMPEASETGNPPRSLADILDTLRSMPPANPMQAAQQVQQPGEFPHVNNSEAYVQRQTGAHGQGFALPNQNGSMDQPPLPGLFQSQHVDADLLPGRFQSQSLRNARRPVVSQPQGEIKMPRGFTGSMRQWAKGWVRTGDIKLAGTLLLRHFPLLQRVGGKGLENYLVELKRQVEGQSLDQMEQPGGWTDSMTNLVIKGLDDGKDLDTIVSFIKMDPSYPTNKSEPDMPDMEGIELYVEKLRQTQTPAPAPAGWTDEMTELVKENLDIEFEFVEELLKNLCDFRADDPKSLTRYLERLQRERGT